jgi:hypothetical protein
MASGLEKSIYILKQHPEFEALLIYAAENGDYEMYVTDGLNLE